MNRIVGHDGGLQPQAAALRADLRDLQQRLAFTTDAARPEAVARRRARGQRTARENIDDLCDPGSFIEYGALALAAQRSRRPLDDLIRNTPADGMVTGIGSVNCELFGASRVALRRDGLRRHGARRHAGHAQPPEDRPHARHRARAAPAGVLFAEGGGGGRATPTSPSSPAFISRPSRAMRA
jgi:hypothetical protein